VAIQQSHAQSATMTSNEATIPQEVERGEDVRFEDDGELWEDLKKLNVTDLQIVLDDEGYAVWREMPHVTTNCGYCRGSRQFLMRSFYCGTDTIGV
jgi:hypothetical protein